jgi:hypothetical protein
MAQGPAGQHPNNPFSPFPMDQSGSKLMGAQMIEANDQGFLDNVDNHVVRARIR